MAHLLMFSFFLYMVSFLSYIQLYEISEIGAMSDPRAGYPICYEPLLADYILNNTFNFLD